MTGIVGHGATLTYQGGLIGEPRDMRFTGISRENFDISHMGTTGGKDYGFSPLYDLGSLEIDFLVSDPDADFPTAFAAAAEAVVVTFSNGNTWSMSGGFENLDVEIPWGNGPVSGTLTLKLSGDLTVAAS